MPTVVALPRKIVSAALGATGKVLAGAITSGSVKGLVSNVADKLFVEESIAKVDELDVPFWASWFAWAGYSNHAGFKNFAAAVKPKLPTLSPEEIVSLTEAFHKAGYYDKDLFTGIGANISAGFTKYDTEGLLKVLAAFNAFGHYERTVLDDIADSITYCNHYLATTKVTPLDIAAAFEAYVKADVERGDLFTTLARGVSELSLSKLDESARKEAVLSLLRSFYAFQFFPEQIEALLYYTSAEASLFSADELKEVDKIRTLAEDLAGGELKTYAPDPHEDSTHWYGHHAPHHPPAASLFVFRDSLVPSSYSPATLRHSK